MELKHLPKVHLVGFLFFVSEHLLFTQAGTVFDTDVTNIQFFGDYMFVAGNGYLYKIEKDSPNITKEISTCKKVDPYDKCNNVIKVLEINQKDGKVLLCGTGNEGQCLVGQADTLEPISEWGSSTNLKVYTNASSGAFALVTQNDAIELAVTYGGELPNNPDGRLTVQYTLSTWLISGNAISPNRSLSLSIDANFIPYLIFYKAAFEHAGRSYFLTNQKNYANEPAYVTKVVRVCHNDQNYQTYIDAVLSCKTEEENYTLLQDALIIVLGDDRGKLFVGTFTAANDPVAVTGESAICVEKVSKLDKEIDNNRNIAIRCPWSPPTSQQQYLLGVQSKCFNTTNTISACEKNVFINKAIGRTPIALKPVFNLNEDKGHITKISGTLTKDRKNLVLIAGTSLGHILKLRLDVTGTTYPQAEEYEDITVRTNSSIRAINIQDTSAYVLTQRRVDKLMVANCPRFKTCKETHFGNDPNCGWCVLQSKSTTEADCPKSGQWIPPGGSCVEIDLHHERVLANGSQQEINLTVSNLNDLDSLSAGLKCSYKLDKKEVVGKTDVSGNTVRCYITVPSVHTKTMLELRWNDKLLAESRILFYKCSKFTMCGDCTEERGQNLGSGCVWCTGSLTCLATSDTCSSIPLDAKPQCPRLMANNDIKYVPNGVVVNLNLAAKNLPQSGFNYTCKVCIREFRGTATSTTNITCELKFQQTSTKSLCPVKVMYGKDSHRRYIDEDDNTIKVIVYRCEGLAEDCTHCKAINDGRYTCKWCGSTCKYNPNTCDDTCPAPSITKVDPQTSSTFGGTKVTIQGSNLINGPVRVQFGGKKGENCALGYNTNHAGDYKEEVPDQIVCNVPQAADIKNQSNVTISVTIGDRNSTSQQTFYYLVPKILDISPKSGPKSGGTLLTFTGENLGIGNQLINIFYNYAHLEDCIAKQIANKGVSTYLVVCRIPSSIDNNLTSVRITLDGDKRGYQYEKIHNKNISFDEVSDPEITGIHPVVCTSSGGTHITVTGQNINHANDAMTRVKYAGQEEVQPCSKNLEKNQVICKCPKAPESVKEDLKTLIDSASSKRRRKRDTSDTHDEDSIQVEVIVALDGFEKDFSFSYYVDPSFDQFEDVKVFESDEKTLVFSGRSLNLVAKKHDVTVKIGINNCAVVQLTRTELTCVVTRSDEGNDKDQEVTVEIGNYRQSIGYIRYEHPFELLYLIAGVSGAVLAIIGIVAVIAIVKYRRQGSKAKHLQKKLDGLEQEMVTVAREEFLDMHVTMSGVNQNLVEQGFPYHGYLEFASHIIFASGLIHIEPVISENAKTGLETFEQLLRNKFFLLSVISTMEKQKKFFLREKANFAGHLCQVLMGRMEYLNEIIGLLIQHQVKEAAKKKHLKSLFRRSESITENLLNDWLFLCLYHHIKADTGSPLYLLYIVMQKTMESGPIDAVTGDSKYTLCEEKLLKKWRSTDPNNRDEVTFEAKSLNLRVIVDNGTQIYDCKALDCDTITQVKRKCMSQIYVNYPASQLAVDASDLKFNWHAGSCGLLPLADRDLTSKREGSWVRLNTLAHYNVTDDANMALVDPKSELQNEEDYENFGAMVMTQRLSGEADNLGLIPDTKDDDLPEYEWHLIKPNSVREKQEKSAVDDLYLNRLITTKQSIVKYMTDLFDVILSKDRCPAPVKRIFDLFDSLEATYKLDSDTVHKWKSHSYLIRVWGSLMSDPSRLFDINVPPYVESSLGVASQVFIDACSQTSTDVTKDTSPQKLSFINVVKQYREKIAPFHDDVKATEQSQDDLRRYFDVVNKLQKQQNFPKTSSLHKIYDQLKPYMDIIIDELSQNKEASSLLLNQKLSQVIQLMEEDV